MNRKLLVLLFFGVLMGALDIAILGPALPAIKSSFTATARQLTWIVNIYILANLLGTPLLSKLSDIFGRRWIYIIAVAFFGVGSLIIVLSNNFNLLVLGRGIQGFGSGGFFPVASAVIGDTFPKEKQGSALGLIGAVFGLAFLVGPIIGGLLLMIGWHWIFILNIPFSIALIIGALELVPTKKMKGRIRLDWMGMTLLLACLALFTFSINEIDTQNFWDSVSTSQVFPYLVATFVFLPVFIYSQKKSPTPILAPRLFRSKQLLIAYIIALGSGLGEVGVIFIPGFAKSSFNLSDYWASFYLMPLIFALFIGSPVAGRMLDILGSRFVLLLGTLLLAAGLLGLSWFPAMRLPFFTAEVVMGLGLAAVLGAPLRYIINHETTEHDRALGQGVVSVFMSIGQLISAALVGALVASLGGGTLGFRRAFLALAIVSVLMIIASLGLKKK